MAISAEDVKSLLTHGAGVTVSANNYSVDDLKSFATYAKNNGLTLHVINAGSCDINALKSIASYATKEGSEHCHFDLT